MLSTVCVWFKNSARPLGVHPSESSLSMSAPLAINARQTLFPCAVSLATCSGVRPWKFTASSSAPHSSSRLMISQALATALPTTALPALPSAWSPPSLLAPLAAAAKWSGVLSSWLVRHTVPPRSGPTTVGSSIRTTSTWPAAQARCRERHPWLVCALGTAPASSRFRTKSTDPFRLATCRGVHPHESGSFTTKSTAFAVTSSSLSMFPLPPCLSRWITLSRSFECAVPVPLLGVVNRDDESCLTIPIPSSTSDWRRCDAVRCEASKKGTPAALSSSVRVLPRVMDELAGEGGEARPWFPAGRIGGGDNDEEGDAAAMGDGADSCAEEESAFRAFTLLWRRPWWGFFECPAANSRSLAARRRRANRCAESSPVTPTSAATTLTSSSPRRQPLLLLLLLLLLLELLLPATALHPSCVFFNFSNKSKPEPGSPFPPTRRSGCRAAMSAATSNCSTSRLAAASTGPSAAGRSMVPRSSPAFMRRVSRAFRRVNSPSTKLPSCAKRTTSLVAV
mmetsp:Transcript_81711/g.163133  ORF Transcript_81711/g.163133 Transcript_81711/m.163133 type:complete len:509 (-) Transcript_81711:256-1782(-)